MAKTTRKETNAELVHYWLGLKDKNHIRHTNALTQKIKNLKIWDWRWMKWSEGWHRGRKAQKPDNYDWYNTIFDKDEMPLLEEASRAKLKALQNYYRRKPDLIPPLPNSQVSKMNLGPNKGHFEKEIEIQENNDPTEIGSLSNGQYSNNSPKNAPANPSTLAKRPRHFKVHNLLPQPYVGHSVKNWSTKKNRMTHKFKVGNLFKKNKLKTGGKRKRTRRA